jgi:hypothetical protein
MQVEIKKPSEKIVSNPIDGMQVTDSSGRVLRLRKPDILDMYDLYSAIGEDTKNVACLMLATKCMYVAAIDGSPVECPKSYAQFRATLKRINEFGLTAVDEALLSFEDVKTEKEAIEKVKKS